MRGKKRKVPPGFGKRLEKAIIDSGKKYMDAEIEVGINHTNLYQYVNETMLPSAYNLYAICLWLNISADYLLFGEERYCDKK